MPTCEALTLGVSIERDWRAVYAFASRPETFPLWASGLGADFAPDGDVWTARGPEGPIRVRFSPPNPFGVLDHVVTAADGTEVHNAFRVVPNGSGAEILFTLLRQPGMDAETFVRDADWVRRDLEALKALLEGETDAVPEAISGPEARIDYVELVVADIARSRAFYGSAFGWTFKDYGPGYCEFSDGRLTGGFAAAPEKAPAVAEGGPLVVLHAPDLARVQQRLEQAGAEIVRPVFAFPGGRRFHFRDPDGYELAVWSES